MLLGFAVDCESMARFARRGARVMQAVARKSNQVASRASVWFKHVAPAVKKAAVLRNVGLFKKSAPLLLGAGLIAKQSEAQAEQTQEKSTLKNILIFTPASIDSSPHFKEYFVKYAAEHIDTINPKSIEAILHLIKKYPDVKSALQKAAQSKSLMALQVQRALEDKPALLAVSNAIEHGVMPVCDLVMAGFEETEDDIIWHQPSNNEVARKVTESIAGSVLFYGAETAVEDLTGGKLRFACPAYNDKGGNFGHYGCRLTKWALRQYAKSLVASYIVRPLSNEAFGPRPEK